MSAVAAAAWPLAGRAQQLGKVPIIGFLAPASPEVASPWVAAFAQRLRELGWIEGRNIAIEYRWAGGHTERLAGIATELVQLPVDILVTWSNEADLMAHKSTSTIPIVFATSTDPIATGLVPSLSRPGGNMTGLSALNVDIAGKRVELLREIVPNAHRLAILVNVASSTSVLETNQVETAARRLGLDVTTLKIKRAEDIGPAFEALDDAAQALFVVGEPLTYTHRAQINTLAQRARLPTMYAIREFVAAGGLMSYGANFRTFSVVLLNLSTKSYTEQKSVTFRSSSPRNLTSSSI